jgi:DNA-binding MarR family transcriptional regulator
MPTPHSPDIDLHDQPGHLFRRAQQIAVALFYEHLGRDITPVQYAVMRTLQARPGIDQVTLAQAVALDTSTTAETAVRLEKKGWILRTLLPRRQRALSLTPEGLAALDGLVDGMATMQAELLAPLTPDEQTTFLALLRKFVRMSGEQGADLG